MRNTLPTRRTLLRWSASVGALCLAGTAKRPACDAARSTSPAARRPRLPVLHACAFWASRFTTHSCGCLRALKAAQYAAAPVGIGADATCARSKARPLRSARCSEMRRGGPMDAVSRTTLAAGYGRCLSRCERGRPTLPACTRPARAPASSSMARCVPPVADAIFSPHVLWHLARHRWTSEPRLRGELLAGLAP